MSRGLSTRSCGCMAAGARDRIDREERYAGVARRAEVRRDAAVAHDEAQVELLELVLRRLVDRHDDRLAGLLREVGEQVDERRRVVGGESAGRLVEEQDHRIGHELERDVHALALTAREDLLLGLADLQVPAPPSSPRSRSVSSTRRSISSSRVVGRQAEARRVLHRLEDGELGVDDVVLRDVADDSRGARRR